MAGTPVVPDMRLELVPVPVSDVDNNPDGNMWALQQWPAGYQS